MSKTSPLFQIKACGITRIENAVEAVEAGFDAIGINLYPGSTRFVRAEVAQEISRGVAGQVTRVAVFVNASTETIRKSVDTFGWDIVQLHGDEPLSQVEELVGVPVIKCFRLGDTPFTETWNRWNSRSTIHHPRAILLDSFVAGELGGTGKLICRGAFLAAKSSLPHLPRILAGGLNPENVAEHIMELDPDAVDVASGIESAPGIKDPVLLREFVVNAKRGFEMVRPWGSKS